MNSRKILMVIAHNNFRDEEFLIPKEIFENNNYNVDIVSDRKCISTGKLGYQINIKKSFEDIQNKIDEYCCISITGGNGSKDFLWENKILRNIIIDFYNKNKIIAAICISPIIFAKANLLKNKRVTFYKNDKEAYEIMKQSQCIIENEDVVVDGNIITSNGPESSRIYGNKIIEILNKFKNVI